MEGEVIIFFEMREESHECCENEYCGEKKKDLNGLVIFNRLFWVSDDILCFCDELFCVGWNAFLFDGVSV